MKLKLAEGLSLPLEVVTQKLAWLGVTGSGKTYGASKLAELLFHAGAQFVAIDPVGVWWGVRLDKGGKKPSAITVPVFGGLHGDVPLEPTGGALLANLIVDKALSAIVDVSQFESDAAKARFAADFADRLFQRRKAAPSAMHLFLEECQEFVPQNPQRGDERMLHVFTRMQKLGRNYGIGSSYISQRPQEVNKKALNMAQTLFVFRTTGVHERKAIESWVHDKALDQDIAGDLPKIATGHCHVWSPEFLQISHQVGILAKETFNASATPEVGAAAVARELAPIDLAQIAKDMAATIEKAKADDPRELRKQIKALELQVAGKALIHVATHPQPKIVNVLTDADRALLEKLSARLSERAKKTAEDLTAAESRAERLVQTAVAEYLNTTRSLALDVAREFETMLGLVGFRKIFSKLAIYIPTPNVTGSSRTPPAALQGRRVAAAAATSRPASLPSSRNGTRSAGGDGSLAPGERKILTAVAQFGEVDRGQLTVLVGYKATARDTYISRLAQKGLVESGQGRVRVLPAGVEALGADYEPLPTGDALLDFWRGRLAPGECKVLEAVVGVYPQAASRADIGDQTGYKPTARDTYISRLASRRLLKSDGRGSVRASEELFS